MNCVCLAQLLALCGSVAFWQVSHLERSVSSELRRRRLETEEREEKEKGPSSKAKVRHDCCAYESSAWHFGGLYLVQNQHLTLFIYLFIFSLTDHSIYLFIVFIFFYVK